MGLFGDPIVAEVGGRGGGPFDDGLLVGSGSGFDLSKKITAVQIRAGDVIDSIRLKYGSDWGRIHGGNGGQLYEFELNGDDILSVEAHHSQFVNSIKLILSNGQVIGPYGTSIGLRKSVCYQPAENRGLLAYISGSSGEFLDKIAFHFEAKVAKVTIGGSGGSVFSDFQLSGSNAHSSYNVDKMITAIGIRAGDSVDAIRFRFGNFWGAWHGKQGGKLHQIELNGRTIQKVTAYYTRWLNSIKIVLNDGSVFGPFGRKNGDKKVASFIPPSSGFLSFVKGASGDLVDRLELYFEELKVIEFAKRLSQERELDQLQRQQQREQSEQRQRQLQEPEPVLPQQQTMEPSVAEDSIRCIICEDSDRNAIFLPCGHFHTCLKCAEIIEGQSRLCPICKTDIQNVHRVFM